MMIKTIICLLLFCLPVSVLALDNPAGIVRPSDHPIISGPAVPLPFLPNQKTDTRINSAQDFVMASGLDNGLKLLLLHDVKQDSAIQQILTLYGMEKTGPAVVKAIKTAHKNIRDDWRTILADQYQQHFSLEELQSIVRDQNSSRVFDKFLSLQQQIVSTSTAKAVHLFKKARLQIIQDVKTSFSETGSDQASLM